MSDNFSEQIYLQLIKVPKGKITTYKALAHSLGSRAYQAVGTAMKNNPYAPKVPCHRVVLSDGSIGGFMGKKTGKTVTKKIKMLNKEGVKVVNGKVVNFASKLFDFE